MGDSAMMTDDQFEQQLTNILASEQFAPSAADVAAMQSILPAQSSPYLGWSQALVIPLVLLLSINYFPNQEEGALVYHNRNAEVQQLAYNYETGQPMNFAALSFAGNSQFLNVATKRYAAPDNLRENIAKSQSQQTGLLASNSNELVATKNEIASESAASSLFNGQIDNGSKADGESGQLGSNINQQKLQSVTENAAASIQSDNEAKAIINPISVEDIDIARAETGSSESFASDLAFAPSLTFNGVENTSVPAGAMVYDDQNLPAIIPHKGHDFHLVAGINFSQFLQNKDVPNYNIFEELVIGGGIVKHGQKGWDLKLQSLLHTYAGIENDILIRTVQSNPDASIPESPVMSEVQIRPVRLYFLEIPLMAQYQYELHKLEFGAYASVFLSARSYVTRREIGVQTATARSEQVWGYQEGFSSFDAGFAAGYQYQLLPNLSAGVRANFGIHDLTNNEVFSVQKVDNLMQYRVLFEYQFGR